MWGASLKRFGRKFEMTLVLDMLPYASNLLPTSYHLLLMHFKLVPFAYSIQVVEINESGEKCIEITLYD